jgi:integrase
MRKFPSQRTVAGWTKPGRYAVGHGVYLQISRWNTRAWVFRYVRNGKARHMGLGSAEYVTLAEARGKGYELRRQLIAGVDPLESKRALQREDLLASTRAKTFKQCTLECIAAHEDTWRGNYSRKQWIGSFEKHVFPKIGNMPVSAIDVVAVLSVLDPIARDIPVSAGRIKHRLGQVLDWAAARELRPHDNPARRPNLLPKRKPPVTHFAAMPYTALPSFLVDLRERPEISARALEFLILTAARPNESLGARWSETDLKEAIWSVPGERMKGGRSHRVPLSGRAVELLAHLPLEGEYVFPGRVSGSRPDLTVMKTLLRRMGQGVTAHGFRATFKTWASERTNYPREIIEAALAHIIGDAAEQAYSRGDMLARRRQLMESWAEYCSRRNVEADIVPIRPSAALS